jgi:phosphate transport system substrate-binding protein
MVDIGMVSREVKPEEEQQGAFSLAVAKDAVFPTISAQNPYLQELLAKGVTKEEFAKIYLSQNPIRWCDVLNNPAADQTINVYTRSDAGGAAEVWQNLLAEKHKKIYRDWCFR